MNFFYAVTAIAYFKDGATHISALHATLREGQLGIKNEEWHYCYNLFCPPMLVFERQGIVFHSLLSPLFSDFGKVQTCRNWRTFYFPVEPNIPIDIGFDEYEKMMESGIISYYSHKYKFKYTVNQFNLLAALEKSEETTFLQTKTIDFGPSSGLDPRALLFPDNIESTGFWVDRAVWILSEKLYDKIKDHINNCYYNIVQIAADEVNPAAGG